MTRPRRSKRPGAPAPLAASHRKAVRKYAVLCAKYHALVRKYEHEGSKRSSVMLLALAAMRAGATALAAIRDGTCVVRNDLWLRMATERGRVWRPVAGGQAAARAPSARTLEELALAGAAELVASGETSHVAQWEHSRGETVVELRLERAWRASPPLVLAMITDATVRVRAERELARMREVMEAQERLRAVGELASGVAHDLNNTLHAMRLRLSRLAACVGECEEHAEDLRVVERIAADAGARVRRLQDLAHRREDLPDERVDLRRVLAGAVEVAAGPADSDPGPRHAVDVHLPAVPAVAGNAAELVHVFVNLLSNARDAMPHGGRITITGGRTRDGGAEISIADEGPGIPRENLARIFEPFFTTKGRRGTGLGLSIAAGVMRRIGGTIIAENRRRGGARFVVRFPPARASLPEPATPGAGGVEVASRRVLVVDDDPDNLEAMRLVLEQHGHHVEVTDSGRDAIARVESGERYDIVLCDLGLGDATGWDVAAGIRAAAPGTRVLLVTGWAEEIAPDDPRRRHVARVLSKPVGVDDLRDIFRDVDGARPGNARAQPPELTERASHPA